MAGFLGGIATTQLPGYVQKGCTIGNYGADYNGGDQRPFNQAIADGHRTLVVVNGTFRFSQSVVVTVPNVRILCDDSVIFVPSSGAIGLWNVSGDRFAVVGGKTQVETTPVANQAILRIQADDYEISRHTLDVQVDGDPANPTIFAQLGPAAGATTFLGGHVSKNVFCPAKGITLIKTRNSRKLHIGRNRVGRLDASEVNPRGLFRFLDCFDDQWTVLEHNKILGVGDAGNLVDALIFFDGTAGSSEKGHMTIVGDQYEQVRCDWGMRFKGVNFLQMDAVKFGKWDSVTNRCVQITDDDEDEDQTEAGRSSNVEVHNVEWHNCQKSLALGHVFNAHLVGCNFNTAPAGVQQLFLGQVAHAGAPATDSVFLYDTVFETSAAPARAIQLTAANNIKTVDIANCPIIGNWGAIWNGPPPSNVNSAGTLRSCRQVGSTDHANVTW